MLSACQRDATLRQTIQTVVDVEARDDGDFDVILDDSILFAEGGGQPADRGWLDEEAVVDVQKGPDGRPRHRVAKAPALGAAVSVRVAWERRWDHMQQHTGQHLLSALLADRWGLQTVGFHLGAQGCSVDLDGALSAEQMVAAEAAANAAIQADHPVTVRSVDTAALEELGVRSRGLPGSVQGTVRLVEIEGLDRNTCGGTHVSRTGALQLIHLTRRERVRGGTRLGFLVGGRALRHLRALADQSAALSGLLRSAPEEQLARVQALLDERKADRRALRGLGQQLAEARAAALASHPGPVLVHVDPTADLGALRTLATATLGADDPRSLLAIGADVFLLRGPETVVTAAGARVADALAGRGGGRGTTFQGRAGATHPAAVSAARHLLEDAHGTTH